MWMGDPPVSLKVKVGLGPPFLTTYTWNPHRCLLQDSLIPDCCPLFLSINICTIWTWLLSPAEVYILYLLSSFSSSNIYELDFLINAGTASWLASSKTLWGGIPRPWWSPVFHLLTITMRRWSSSLSSWFIIILIIVVMINYCWG